MLYNTLAIKIWNIWQKGMMIIDYSIMFGYKMEASGQLQDIQQCTATLNGLMGPEQGQQLAASSQGMVSSYPQGGIPGNNVYPMYPGQPMQGMPVAYPQVGHPMYDPAYVQRMEKLQAQVMREAEKDRQAAMQANAYSEAISCSGMTLVNDPRGNVHSVLDLEIKRVRHIMPDLLHKTKGYYEITFSNKAKVIIGEDEFYKSGRLLDRISEGTGRKARIVPTKYRTTELLRETILSMTEELAYPFYVGWQKGSKWEFVLIEGTTHSTRTMPLCGPEERRTQQAPKTATEEVIATEQIIRLFETMSSPELAITVVLWFHTAVLITLINEMGHRLRMGLCFYSTEPQVFAYLESIFCWYADNTIELTVPKGRLLDLRLERKDEPAVLHDKEMSKGNTELLRRVMTTGEIPVEIGNGYGCPPLNSLPTVFSSSVSKLSHSANFATIDVCMDDIRTVPNSALKGLSRHIPDYLMTFCSYIRQNIELLESCLSEAMDEASAIAEDMSREGLEMLAVELGVRKIVASFYEHLALPGDLKIRADRLLNGSDLKDLREALACSAGVGGDTEDLAMYFIGTVDEMIRKGSFDCRQVSAPDALDPCKEGKEGIVYADEVMVSFTQKAFRAVCKACGVSGPIMVNALKAAGLLRGKPINQECLKTRITVGVRPATKRVSVYQFERESLNQ